jgi:hypothetical protein
MSNRIKKSAAAKTATRSTKSASGKSKTTAAPAKAKQPAGTKASRPAPATYSAPRRLPSVWQLCRIVARTLRRNPRLFLGVTAVYVALSLLLVGGMKATLDTQTMKDAINTQEGKLAGSLGVFAILLSGANGSPFAGGYQFIIMLLCSLAIIWALRHVLAGSATARVRDAFYFGTYPLVPAVLVLLVVLAEFVPLMIGLSICVNILTASVGMVEKILVVLLGLALAWLSAYLVTGSIFSLYIAALPEMTPVKALRSARRLAKGRRWPLVRKLLFLPLVLVLCYAVIVVPVLLTVTAAAPWVLYGLLLLTLPVAHTYLYMLYRELLE